jgi:hypothetical protein
LISTHLARVMPGHLDLGFTFAVSAQIPGVSVVPVTGSRVWHTERVVSAIFGLLSPSAW